MIELRNICRNFQVGDQCVASLRNVNLQVESGEYVSVMGPSGSGKSTLLNIISLLDQPNSGQYILQGNDVTELQDEQLALIRLRHIGFVFQFFHLIPRLSARENIAMPMILAGIEPKRRKQRIAEVIDAVGLGNRADHRPDQLSGGQRQRVAIARAMIMQPDILLADEPTGNLDSTTGTEIMRLLEQLNEQGVTLMVITHDRVLGSRAKRNIQIVDGQVSE